MNLDSILKKKNIIIFFFMNGCPYCEQTKPAWDELKHKTKGMQFIEIESQEVPTDKRTELGIEGYPHFIKIDKKGKRKSVSGSKPTADALSKALFSKAGGRRNTKRFVRRVRKTLRRF
jgi:thiol-disulfide isomerase/thioredoxin